MDYLKELEEKREEFGIHQLGVLDTDKLSFSTGVRELCEANSCGHYNRSWTCPPGVGTFEECKAKILTFNKMFVYTTKHQLEDSFDIEGMEDGKRVHGEISARIRDFFKENYQGEMLILSADGCNICEKCTYPDAPCRFPDRSFPSVESYGVEVYRLAQELEINYINGVNTVTYFGCIAFDKK